MNLGSAHDLREYERILAFQRAMIAATDAKALTIATNIRALLVVAVETLEDDEVAALVRGAAADAGVALSFGHVATRPPQGGRAWMRQAIMAAYSATLAGVLAALALAAIAGAL